MQNDVAAPHTEYRVILNANYSGFGVISNAPVTGKNPAGDIEAGRCGADCQVRDADGHLESNSTTKAYVRPSKPPN